MTTYLPRIDSVMSSLFAKSIAMRMRDNDPTVVAALTPCRGSPEGVFSDPPSSLRFQIDGPALWWKTTPRGDATGWVIIADGAGPIVDDPYYIDAADYGVVDDGADHSAGLQAAMDAAVAQDVLIVQVPAGTIELGSTVRYHGDITLRGQGAQATIFHFTGTGYTFEQSTPGTRIFNVKFHDFQISYEAAAAGGIHLDDVSLARLDNVAVFGPGLGSGSGFRISGSTNGFAVYNAFYHCRALSCDDGFLVDAAGSNDTHLFDCRATACARGVYVLDSNHIVIEACAIESSTRGVVIDASISAVSDSLTIANTRFEGNTAANIQFGDAFAAANVRYPNIHNNHHVTGTPIVGAPSFPTYVGDTSGLLQSLQIVTPFLVEPFRLERTVAAPTGEVMIHMVDSNSGSGAPVTVQITTERVSPQIRGVRASITRWELLSDGSASFTGAVGCAGLTTTTLQATGTVSFITAGQNVFLGDGVSAGNVTLENRKADANNLTYNIKRIGTAAAGARLGWQWDSNESDNQLHFDTSGNLLAIRPFAWVYDGTNGRVVTSVGRLATNRNTVLVDGDVALSAGWGSTATVVVAANSNEHRGQMTITPSGAGIALDPTVTLTFPNGTWAAAGWTMLVRNGGSDTVLLIPGQQWTVADNATNFVVQIRGTPTDGLTVIFRWWRVG